MEGVVAGQGARYRSIALAVLDKHEHVLAEFFELLDVALDNDLLIVALDPARTSTCSPMRPRCT